MTVKIDEGVGAARASLDAFFSASVLRHPERPALVVHGRTWSYRALNAECAAMEQVLDAMGLVCKRCNIGVIYAKGVLSYAAVIATMRTDNVYVPLNPKVPGERLLRMIEDARIGALIVDTDAVVSEGVCAALRHASPLKIIASASYPSESLASALKEAPQHEVWRVSDCGHEDWERHSYSGAPLAATALAYIIFTSGSTGIPKGVPITHESACRCIREAHQLFETCERDRFTQFSALSFDVSILDLFLCWKSGAALHVPEPSEALVPMSFAVSHGITVWSSVPSLSNFLLKLRLLKSNALPQLRLSLFCGEALPAELAEAWITAAPQSRVINLYGPTECTIFATYYEYKSQSGTSQPIVPIGRPLPNLQSMVVDEGRVVEEDDVPGELWLSGDQLAAGYWNNQAATEAAFVRFPANLPQADVWYRTGDLVSHRRGIGLSFRGRLDRQIKLRGFRVELQEIESALRETLGCALVAVVPVRNTGGICEQIVAYCDRVDADESTVKDRCARRIPRYMVPDRIIELDTFPLSPSGKVDYLALAARAAVRPGQTVQR